MTNIVSHTTRDGRIKHELKFSIIRGQSGLSDFELGAGQICVPEDENTPEHLTCIFLFNIVIHCSLEIYIIIILDKLTPKVELHINNMLEVFK